MAKSNLLYLKSIIQFRWLSSTASFRKESNSNVDLRARKVKTSIHHEELLVHQLQKMVAQILL